MSSNKRGTRESFIPGSQQTHSPSGKEEKGNIKLQQEGPTVQAGDSKVQNVDHNLPKGGNQTGRTSSQHNSVSGGKSLQGNNARSNPPSDKGHN
ncbi:MAG: hypothetical protein ACO1O1_03025 [Adhaeribacter sp.]